MDYSKEFIRDKLKESYGYRGIILIAILSCLFFIPFYLGGRIDLVYLDMVFVVFVLVVGTLLFIDYQRCELIEYSGIVEKKRIIPANRYSPSFIKIYIRLDSTQKLKKLTIEEKMIKHHKVGRRINVYFTKYSRTFVDILPAK